MTRVLQQQQTPTGNRKVAWSQRISAVLSAALYFRLLRAIWKFMADQKPSESKSPPQNSDPRRTSNPPTSGSKSPPATENTPNLSSDAAIPPDKLTAENDK
jgi:hypothetical protein